MKENGVIYGSQNLCLPSHLNYGKFIIDEFLKYENKIAIINGATREQITFGEMVQQVINTAESLRELGIGEGDVVAICSENRSEFLISMLAVVVIGAVATFINVAYSRDELIHTMNISKPKYIFLSHATFKSYYDILRSEGFIKKYFIYGNSDTKTTAFSDLANKYVDVTMFKAADVNGSRTAIIVYSSGTTGPPKGVKWTHLNLIVAGLQPLSYSRDLVYLSIAPWTNTAGYILAIHKLKFGKTIVFLPKFNETLYLQAIEKYKVGFLLMVPPLVVMMSKSTIISKFDVSSVEIVYSGGAYLDAKVMTAVRKRFPNVKHVLQGYGMSEATGVITEESETANKLGSVGRVVPGIIMKVVDIESRKLLGPNQTGEICLSGLALFGGYIGKVSGDDYDTEGFYKSGDLAYYDEDGFFYIVDRLKELIKYKTWQVAPSDLEAILLAHPGVRDAAVIGIPDTLAGEIPTSFIVKQNGFNPTEKEIVEYVAAKVSPWKQLRGGVKFVEIIPKNGSGKILRRLLRDSLTKTSKL